MTQRQRRPRAKAKGQDVPPTTPGGKIVKGMTDLGYAPGPKLLGDVVEFRKDLAVDDEGLTRARFHVYFDKPLPGARTRFANLVISTQQTIDTETIETATRDPRIAPTLQAELRDLITTLGEFFGMPVRSIATRTCVKCKSACEEYYIVNDSAVCYVCVHGRT